jgi:hypothetical protein
MMKERPTKCIFKVNHTFRKSILLLHVLALQERHLQAAQSILMKWCVCYVISEGRERIRTISSGYFGLPEDGAPAAPKHVAATLIF